ncbi:MAG: oligosaccharide flippase family protein [Phycisphaerales bacterium]
MSIRRKMAGGAGALALGQAGSQVCSFARNVIIARMISKDDFGIASTFFIAVSLLEMVSNLGADRLLVQAADGDDPRFQRTAQLLQVVRGILIGAAMFLLAHPVARLFGIPHVEWAFQCMALVPVLRGFAHLDVSRLQRHMRFGPDAMLSFSMQLLPLALAWPVAAWLNDYRAMLVLIFAQVGTQVVFSHLLAERKYGWAVSTTFASRIIIFGWPLLINGLLLFGTFQGDRLIVGSLYGMEPLAEYGVAFMLTMAPAIMLTKITATLFLPALSSKQADPVVFHRRYSLSFELLTIIAAFVAGLFVVAGGPLVELIYGSRYSTAGTLVAWLGVMQGVRLLRTTQANAAIALADTWQVMASNLFRAFAFVAMLIAAVQSAPLVVIAMCGLGGEVIAFTYTALALKTRRGLPAGSSIRAGAILMVCMGLAIIAKQFAGSSVWQAGLAYLVTASAMVAVAAVFSPHLLAERRRFRQRRGAATSAGNAAEFNTEAHP